MPSARYLDHVGFIFVYKKKMVKTLALLFVNPAEGYNTCSIQHH